MIVIPYPTDEEFCPDGPERIAQAVRTMMLAEPGRFARPAGPDRRPLRLMEPPDLDPLRLCAGRRAAPRRAAAVKRVNPAGALFEELEALIRQSGLTRAELAERLHLDERTLRRRLARPEQMSLGEAVMFFDALMDAS